MATYGHGTLLQMGDGASPEVFTTIAEVKDIKGPSIKRDTIETTSHDAIDYRTFIGGLADGGEVGFDIQFGPSETTHIDTSGLLSKLVGAALPSSATNFQIVLPTAQVWAISGIVTGFEMSAPVGDLLMASITIKVTGKPTWTAL